MLTHRPVAGSRPAVGEPVVRDVDVGANLRRAPWWKAGPVDTCCCGCSLRMGVGLLAMFDIFTTLEVYWVMWIASEWTVLRETIVQMQDECSNVDRGLSSEPEADCARLIQGIERPQEIDQVNLIPLCAKGALYFMAGVVGLWAVFGSNTTAAKCYLWTWAPRFLFAVGTIIYSTPGTLLSILLRVGYLLLLLRFSMVVWSYHEVLLKTKTLGSSPRSTVRGLELSASSPAVEAGSSGNLS